VGSAFAARGVSDAAGQTGGVTVEAVGGSTYNVIVDAKPTHDATSATINTP